MGFGFLIGGIGNIYNYYKLIPIVTIDDDEFYFNDKMYVWNDLQSIEFDKVQRYGGGKIYFKTTTFIFKDRKKIYFFNNFYKNTTEAIEFIKQKKTAISS